MERHEKLVKLPKREADNPLTWEEVVQKFTHAVQSVYSERVQESNAGVLIGSMAEGTLGGWSLHQRKGI